MVRVVNATPDRFTPGNNPVAFVCEAGVIPGPVWTGVGYLTRYRNWTCGRSSPWRVSVPAELSWPTHRQSY